MSHPARTAPLVSLAKTIRSKNAGVDKITFDVIFQDKKSYDLVRESRALSREAICRIYGIPEERISDHVEFVFIDALHIYDAVLRDFSGILPYLAESAYILLHDTYHQGIDQAVREVVDANPIRRELAGPETGRDGVRLFYRPG